MNGRDAAEQWGKRKKETMRISDYFNSRRGMIDRALYRLIPPEDQYPEEIHRALHYALFPGGKRFRPILVMASYETFEGNPERALPFACAVELVHSYSLVHDDLPALDNDLFRREKYSLHKAFGEDTAILAGDALLTSAFSILADRANHGFSPSKTLRAIKEITSASGTGGMIGGQVADMRRKDGFALRDLEYIHLRKTADLITCAASLGPILAGAGRARAARLADYGKNLGLSFQMIDDIKDAGKTQGEPNFADSFGVKSAEGKALAYAEAARRNLVLLDRNTEILDKIIDFLLETGGIKPR